MPTFQIDRIMQSFVHDHQHREWYAAQAGEPDTILTRLDKNGKRISEAVLKGAGHGSSIGISHDSDGHPLIWLWWNNVGPVTFKYEAGMHEHTSAAVTKLPNVEKAYTLFALDERHNLIATRCTNDTGAQRFTLRHLSDYQAGIDKPLHRTGYWPVTRAFQGFAINDAGSFWVASGGSKETTDVREYTWDATGPNNAATIHNTMNLGTGTGYHETEGVAFGSRGGLWVGIITAHNGGHQSTAHQITTPPEPQPPPKEKNVSVLQGVDVSSFQTVAQWRAHKPKFVIAKAHEGLSWHDPGYRGHRSAARADRLLFGAYTYVWPEYDAAACCRDFLNYAALKSGEVGIIDFEPYKSKSNPSTWPEWVLKFATEYRKETGAWPWLYLNHDMATRLLSHATAAQAKAIRELPLWLAAYSTGTGSVHGWSALTAWQYTDKPIDLDRFYADAATWKKLGMQGKADPPKPKPKGLKVDGSLGPATITALEGACGTTQDGELSTPSQCVSHLQGFLNAKGYADKDGNVLVVDGLGLQSNASQDYGPTHTIEALQRFLGTTIDGVLSKGDSQAVRALQEYLNSGKKF